MPLNRTESTIFDFLLLRGRVSAGDLGRHLDIPQSTAVTIMQRLVRRGVARRAEVEGGRRGRPVVFFEPRLPRPVIACQFNGTQIAAAIVREDLSIAASDAQRVNRVESAAQAKDLLGESLQRL